MNTHYIKYMKNAVLEVNGLTYQKSILQCSKILLNEL